MIIDLNTYNLNKHNKVLSTSFLGEKISKDIKLTKMVNIYGIITINLPNNCLAVTPSFYCGLLKDLIGEYGYKLDNIIKISQNGKILKDDKSFLESIHRTMMVENITKKSIKKINLFNLNYFNTLN
jgi:hypothetical protein